MIEIKKLLSQNILIRGQRQHQKASELYLDVTFKYPNHAAEWVGSVPIHYRRTGTFAETSEEIAEVIKRAYEAMNPDNREQWLKAQEEFWNESAKDITRAFFNGLKDSKWKCVTCQLPPNPNWARRVQDIKELGYTLATDTKKYCRQCDKNTTQLILLRLPRGVMTGYEGWSPALRKRIIDVLNHYDVYEDRRVLQYSLLPDHKFSEIRWDERTREENPDHMSDSEIKKNFSYLRINATSKREKSVVLVFKPTREVRPSGFSFFTRATRTGRSACLKLDGVLKRGASVAVGMT